MSSVSTGNADGAYKAGDTIHVLVTFSKAVTVAGGTPNLALNTAPSRSATYVSGSGGATLTFDYTIQAGDTSARLDAAAANALSLNGATIRDIAANNADTTVATGAGTSGALANAKNIVVDTAAPDCHRRHVVDRKRLLQGGHDGFAPGQLQRERQRHRHSAARSQQRSDRRLLVRLGDIDPHLRLHRRRRRHCR